mmetsp:Transcript_1463/g.3158  ORF Transcript_1463/g.3158 Transcript_1463/m.3158 type:complete len:157 (-) Transcript_1463:322-792(-)
MVNFASALPYLYEETWTTPWAPLVFFLPCFYKYGIRIDGETLTFGYGCTFPGRLAAVTVPREEIIPGSVTSGSATWKDNMFRFGGWGVRAGRIQDSFGWAYVPSNGPFVEVKLRNGTAYRFVTRKPLEVVTLLSTAGQGDAPIWNVMDRGDDKKTK